MTTRISIARLLLIGSTLVPGALLISCAEDGYDSTPNTQLTPTGETTSADETATADAASSSNTDSTAGNNDDASPPAAEAEPIAFTVNGMHCDGCASFLTKALSKLDGVASCEVSYADARAVVTPAADADPEAVLQTAIDEVDALNYQAERSSINRTDSSSDDDSRDASSSAAPGVD